MGFFPRSLFVVLTAVVSAAAGLAAAPLGYYRQPTIYKDVIVFVSEGDLWRVSVKGGMATRLTSHPGDEARPAFSPDGRTLAFSASYEGPEEIYTMPAAGGEPVRRTYGAGKVMFVGWTRDGKVLYATDRYATLPGEQLVALDISKPGVSSTPKLVPLAQAAEGVYDDTGKTLFFTRLAFQGSHTKRYRGGTAQNLWKLTEGEPEAKPLTAGYTGTSKCPMWWEGRVYFLSDRDGTMNIWSMKLDGSDLKQHTRHSGWDAASASLTGGKIVYQIGADIHLYEIAAERDRLLPIALASDLDQRREHWIKNPMDYLTAAHLSPDGGRVVLTARGKVFVVPHRQGRLVQATHKEGIRYREAIFMPDGKSLVALSDESGEVELWTVPANGIGKPERLTTDGDVLRWDALPAPDAKLIAHRDKNQRLFLYDLGKKKNVKIDESKIGEFTDLSWSPDGKWLAYVALSDNQLMRIKLYSVADGQATFLSSDRFDSYSPAWSPDGQWLYFLSDRHLQSVVKSPWGSYQPEPFLDKKTKIYHVPLTLGLRSHFAHATELSERDVEKKEKPKNEKAPAQRPPAPVVKIDLDGIQTRLIEVPVPPGNYSNLVVNDNGLFFLATPAGAKTSTLMGVKFARNDVAAKTITDHVKAFEASQDGKKLLIRKLIRMTGSLYVTDASVGPANLEKAGVDLSNWKLSVVPRDEWRQMFVEAWRLERDYFYDRGMHGLDWKAMIEKYAPLVERVNSRSELSDVIAQLVSELSALHIFVRGGDERTGEDKVATASLGAVLSRDEQKGGYTVGHVYRSDPDEPERAGPLRRPNVDVKEGEVIESIDGVAALSVPDAGVMLRGKAGQQVLLRVKPVAGGVGRDVIVRPIGGLDDAELRYHDWEYTRRLKVDLLGRGEIGYLHLRAMGGKNFSEWAKGFYPVFTRQGLIVDVRNNRGGNIDSWIINRLLRKAWFYWSQRVGRSPTWNMQYAFRGYVVVLCNESTASDGEAFTEGIKRLGIGKVIGTRTWGGEIWLSADNFLVDKGIATSAEFGVFGPKGTWLIEGHGVDPDIVVDNLPVTTFKGEDAQLKAAIAYLQKRIKDNPITVPPVPKFPNKAISAK